MKTIYEQEEIVKQIKSNRLLSGVALLSGFVVNLINWKLSFVVYICSLWFYINYRYWSLKEIILYKPDKKLLK